MNEVFRAINDSNRRLLMDRLLAEDGQTLGTLCGHLPNMTRFGVMSHLRVLEDAGLVVTHKVGRSKHHYLTPVPIRMIHDRWISTFTEATIGRIARIKTTIEGEERMTSADHVYQAYIAAPASRVWEAIINGDDTVRYFYGTRVESDWVTGAEIRYLGSDGAVMADGTVISIEHGSRLDMTFHPHWDPELEAEGPVRQAWIVEEQHGVTSLTVETRDMDPSSKTHGEFTAGIPYIVSGLKTLAETGAAMAGV